MPVEKPQPLMVGNKAYYTLSSYDPVQVTVHVSHTTDEEVTMGLEAMLSDLGATMDALNDPAWVSEHFEGLSSLQEVREAMRQELEFMNMQVAESQKATACVEELTKRLRQSVTPQRLAEAREIVDRSFAESLDADGLTVQQFMERTGTTEAMLETMLEARSRDTAEGSAALLAYAREKKIRVDESELPALMGATPEQAQQVVASSRAAGQYDRLMEGALLSKVTAIVIGECVCTYQHETPAEARERVNGFIRYQQMMRQRSDEQDSDAGDDEPPAQGRTGFKLV